MVTTARSRPNDDTGRVATGSCREGEGPRCPRPPVRNRIVALLVFVLQLLVLAFRRLLRPLYDAESRRARHARLARQLLLLEGGPAGKVSSVLHGSRARPSRRKVKIIVNPVSGRGAGLRAIPRLRRGLRELGYDVEIVVTERAGQAEEACFGLESNVAAVVAVGGDGTLNEVINGVGDQPTPIAVYSTGTANCIGTEFEIPREPELFCRMIDEGCAVCLDVAEVVGRRRFHSFAGVGFDAKVVEELSKVRTGAILMSAYIRPILTALRSYKWPRVAVEVDGETIRSEASFVIVSNIRTYAIMEAAPAASATDGLLDICIFEKPGWLALARYALGAFTRTHTLDHDVVYVQGRHVRLSTAADRVPIQIDGDQGGYLPAELRVLPGAIRFLVPAHVQARLTRPASRPQDRPRPAETPTRSRPLAQRRDRAVLA
ncbi:MAG: diacylglycerol kinase family lipid kinase [Planctomycetota bacterium]|nr:MAG: diacylglycerol kinase family lipid kinase [Planctomycetota bacterium]